MTGKWGVIKYLLTGMILQVWSSIISQGSPTNSRVPSYFLFLDPASLRKPIKTGTHLLWEKHGLPITHSPPPKKTHVTSEHTQTNKQTNKKIYAMRFSSKWELYTEVLLMVILTLLILLPWFLGPFKTNRKPVMIKFSVKRRPKRSGRDPDSPSHELPRIFGVKEKALPDAASPWEVYLKILWILNSAAF